VYFALPQVTATERSLKDDESFAEQVVSVKLAWLNSLVATAQLGLVLESSPFADAPCRSRILSALDFARGWCYHAQRWPAADDFARVGLVGSNRSILPCRGVVEDSGCDCSGSSLSPVLGRGSSRYVCLARKTRSSCLNWKLHETSIRSSAFSVRRTGPELARWGACF
jgi:hypothetical protein